MPKNTYISGGLVRKRVGHRKFTKRSYAAKKTRAINFSTTKSNRPKYYYKAYKKAKTARHIVPSMSACASDYLAVQYNPWKTFSAAPCIPDLLQMPSYKLSTRIRGQFQTGNAGGGIGNGWVVMNPFNPCSDAYTTAVVANPNYCAPIWASKASSGGGGSWEWSQFPKETSASTTTTDMATPYYFPSPIKGNSFVKLLNETDYSLTMEYEWRPVGGGIKAQYVGKPMDMQGTYVLYEDPLNTRILSNGSTLYTNLLKLEEIVQTAITDKEVCVMYHPRTRHDLEYSSMWYDKASTTSSSTIWSQDLAGYYTLGIFVTGAGNSQPFNFDAIMFWEMVGTNVPLRTKSHSDVQTLGQLLSDLPTKPSLASPAQQETNARKKFASSKSTSWFDGKTARFVKGVWNTAINIKDAIEVIQLAQQAGQIAGDVVDAVNEAMFMYYGH